MANRTRFLPLYAESSFFSAVFARPPVVSVPVFYRCRLAPASDETDEWLPHIRKRALELFEGNARAAMKWMKEPNRALAWLRPVDLMTSEAGATKVLSLILRIEHGIYS